METALIWLCLILIGLGLLMMVGFGLKNASHRLAGESKMGLAAFALPVLILIVAYFASGDWTSAFVMAAVFTALSGLLALVIAGAKSFFS
ncbi:hypothetical protein RQM47_14160 [Rubrivirga sp. S365]|uniref:hypothetical protein n=1 Tax=Rubrivirga sp. S365 TaxID=3076080 RepID=UPI0028C7B175|nr:hypothetical protein [Rubrivirga sp. S365]MDT7857791.1 hypothetical protein [Rubrivirga sp. S365]